MASNKALVVFCVLLVAALLVTSEVAAQQTQSNSENNVGPQDYRGGYGPSGPGYGRGGPGYGPGYGRGPGNGHGYCRRGCCRRGYRGGCVCCMHPDEIPEPMYIPEVQN